MRTAKQLRRELETANATISRQRAELEVAEEMMRAQGIVLDRPCWPTRIEAATRGQYGRTLARMTLAYAPCGEITFEFPAEDYAKWVRRFNWEQEQKPMRLQLREVPE